MVKLVFEFLVLGFIVLDEFTLCFVFDDSGLEGSCFLGSRVGGDGVWFVVFIEVRRYIRFSGGRMAVLFFFRFVGFDSGKGRAVWF